MQMSRILHFRSMQCVLLTEYGIHVVLERLAKFKMAYTPDLRYSILPFFLQVGVYWKMEYSTCRHDKADVFLLPSGKMGN